MGEELWSAKSRYVFNHALMKREDSNGGKQMGNVWEFPLCGGGRSACGTKREKKCIPPKSRRRDLLRRVILQLHPPGGRCAGSVFGQRNNTRDLSADARRKNHGAGPDALGLALSGNRATRRWQQSGLRARQPLPNEMELIMEAEARGFSGKTAPRCWFKELQTDLAEKYGDGFPGQRIAAKLPTRDVSLSVFDSKNKKKGGAEGTMFTDSHGGISASQAGGDFSAGSMEK